MNLILLFLQFVEFGSLAIGGGFTILPLLFDTFVNQEQLFTADSFGNLISISQMTPGPVTINLATFVGFLTNGVPGAVICSLGLVFPSFVVTGMALFLMKKYKESWFVEGFLKGARLVALVMVLYAVVLFFSMSVMSDIWSVSDIWKSIMAGRFVGPENYHVNLLELGILIVSFILVKKQISVTKILIGAAVFGYAVSFL